MTFATVDVTWRKPQKYQLSSEFGTRYSSSIAARCGISGTLSIDCMPKTNSTRFNRTPACDRRTDRQTDRTQWWIQRGVFGFGRPPASFRHCIKPPTIMQSWQILSCFLPDYIIVFLQNIASFWATCHVDLLPRLCPWTPVGNFHPQTFWIAPSPFWNPGSAPGTRAYTTMTYSVAPANKNRSEKLRARVIHREAEKKEPILFCVHLFNTWQKLVIFRIH